MLIRYAILCFLLLAGSAQAEQACTEIGCVDGLTVSIPPDYPWQPGDYTFDFTVDGKPLHCKGSLPLASCENRNITCDGDGVMIMESGCALPKDTHEFGDIMLETGPSALALTITRNGETIAKGNWQVRYNTSQPNGAGCGPVCRQATVNLDIK